MREASKRNQDRVRLSAIRPGMDAPNDPAVRDGSL
jgi:hypothetical protein